MLEVHPKTGFIKQYRSILNNPICCKDADTFAVWNYLLLKATHKPYYVLFKGAKVLLQPGQLITGRKKIARFWHISESKVQRILKMLKSEQQIEQQTSNVSRLITVSNWDKYQVSEQQSEQPVNNQRTLYKNTKNIKNNNNTKTIIKNK